MKRLREKIMKFQTLMLSHFLMLPLLAIQAKKLRSLIKFKCPKVFFMMEEAQVIALLKHEEMVAVSTVATSQNQKMSSRTFLSLP